MKTPIAVIGLALTLLAGCAGAPVSTPEAKGEPEPAAPLTETVVQEIPGPRPPWIDRIPEATAESLFFVGASAYHSMEQNAREDALRAAVKEFAQYCGVDVSVLAESLTLSVSKASEVIDPTVAQKVREKQVIDAFVSRVKGSEWYSRRLQRSRGPTLVDTPWQAWVLVKVPPDEVAKVQAYQKEKRDRELEKTLAPAVEPYSKAAGLVKAAREARSAGRPLDALGAYLDAQDLYAAAKAQKEFGEAQAFLRARGYEVPLPIEAEAAQLLSELRLEADTATRLVVRPGDGLRDPVRVRAVSDGRPLAGVPVIFVTEGEQARRSTSAEGVASWSPEAAAAWAPGNHAIEARLDHPALRRAVGRFLAPPGVSFGVEVQSLADEDALRENEVVLSRMAAEIARAASASPLSADLKRVAVAPANEAGGASAVGEALAQALGAALARRPELSVLDPRAIDAALAAYGVRATEVRGAEDSQVAAQTLQAGGMIVSEASRDGDRIRLASRLIHAGTGTVVAPVEGTLSLTQAWRHLAGVAAPAGSGVEIAASFLSESRGSPPRPLEDGMTLRSGDHYRLFFEPRQAAYVYAYQVDSAGTVVPLFPNPDFSALANPVPAGRKVWLPSEETWWSLDEMTGTEELVLIASKLPLRKVEEVFAALLKNQRLVESPQELLGGVFRGGPAGGAATRQLLVLGEDRKAHAVAMNVLGSPGLGVVKKVSFLHR